MKSLFTPALVLLCYSCIGQDTHYWALQFGTRSSLMGGAVVGRVNDNSAIFYNPACLAFIDTSSLSINADLYQLEKTKIENALGNQKDFNNNNFKNLPLLISGLISTKNPNIKMGYGFASSVDYGFHGLARIDGNYPVVSDAESPGDEATIGQLSLNSRLTETTFGYGIGNKFNDRWPLGATMLVYWRNHSYERNLYTRMFLNTPGNPLVSGDYLQNFYYDNLRGQLKLGIYYTGDRFDVGLALNSPSFRIFGKGVVAADITANNMLYHGQRIDILANDRQEKLHSVYKTPWSVASGINIDMKRGQLGIAVQYYAGLEIYDILKAKPAVFVRPQLAYADIGSDDFLRVKTGNKSVVNWTVGYEYIISSKFTLDLSFRSDNSFFDRAVRDVKGIKPDISSWDIYHAVVGGNVSGRRLSVSTGILYGFGGNKKYEQDGNLEEPSERNFLQGNTVITKASYYSIGVLFGITINFNKKS